MKPTTLLMAAMSCILLCACSGEQQTRDIEKAKWLIGTWEHNSPEGSMYETWNAKSDDELLGRSYAIAGTDTMVFENIRLVQEDDGLFYIPVVKNQNGGVPVRFSTQKATDTQLVFENQEHDFPQVISYTKITADSLVATISGTIHGQKHKETLSMKRLK